MSNPYQWLTNHVFMQYAQETGVNILCQKCATSPKNFYCDTGSDDGYVPRSSAYTTTDDGFVNMGESRHVPCVRITCMHCGHIDLYSMFAVGVWRDKKLQSENMLTGNLFPPGTISG